MKKNNDIYSVLQKHFDSMPIGFPHTRSGVELKVLSHFFTPEEAEIVLGMDYTQRTAKDIYRRLERQDISLEEAEKRLYSMAHKGAILAKNLKEAEWSYAAMPLVLGMHEMQIPRLTPGYMKDLYQYMNEGFGLEYISTAVPQTRIIPVDESIRPEHKVAPYEEVRKIIENADYISISECICRKSVEISGSSCSVTHRKEVCLGIGAFAEAFNKLLGIGREINKDEALEILRQNEEDGLILQLTNQQDPYFICSCCGDCCGLLQLAKTMPRAADFFASNYYSRVDSEKCTGCGTCVSRCQMEAISLKDKKAVIDGKLCVGCGVCVAACKEDAAVLVKKTRETVPPKTEKDYFEVLEAGKKGRFQKLMGGVKAKMGIPK